MKAISICFIYCILALSSNLATSNGMHIVHTSKVERVIYSEKPQVGVIISTDVDDCVVVGNNPSEDGHFSISTIGEENITNITVLDEYSSTVFSQNYSEPVISDLDLSSLSSGDYTINIYTEECTVHGRMAVY